MNSDQRPDLIIAEWMEYVDGGDLLRLLGSSCEDCETRIFPRADTCPQCSGRHVVDISLGPDAELYSFTAAGDIEAVDAETGEVTVRTELDKAAQQVVLRVSDNGPGIPPEKREAVLGRFVRLEESRNTPGSGLGLSLVAAVAEHHGAALRLDDNRPGLRVEIAFPAPA